MALGILTLVSFRSCPKDKFFPKHRGRPFLKDPFQNSSRRTRLGCTGSGINTNALIVLKSHCEPEGRGNLISIRLLRRSAPRNDK